MPSLSETPRPLSFPDSDAEGRPAAGLVMMRRPASAAPERCQAGEAWRGRPGTARGTCGCRAGTHLARARVQGVREVPVADAPGGTRRPRRKGGGCRPPDALGCLLRVGPRPTSSEPLGRGLDRQHDHGCGPGTRRAGRDPAGLRALLWQDPFCSAEWARRGAASLRQTQMCAAASLMIKMYTVNYPHAWGDLVP